MAEHTLVERVIGDVTVRVVLEISGTNTVTVQPDTEQRGARARQIPTGPLVGVRVEKDGQQRGTILVDLRMGDRDETLELDAATSDERARWDIPVDRRMTYDPRPPRTFGVGLAWADGSVKTARKGTVTVQRTSRSG